MYSLAATKKRPAGICGAFKERLIAVAIDYRFIIH